MKKLRVGVLFGGRSGEHEVSLLSAASILNAIDQKKFDVVPIGITKEGKWVASAHAEKLLAGNAGSLASTESAKHLRAGDPEATAGAAVLARGEAVIVPPVPSAGESHEIVPFQTDPEPTLRQRRAKDGAPEDTEVAVDTTAPHLIDVDIIFPVLHGTF